MAEISVTAFPQQDVRTDLTSGEAAAATHSQRARLVQTLVALSPQEWLTASRCERWTIQDVVRHLTHVNGLIIDAINAALANERYSGFKDFNPRTSPDQLLVEEGPQSAAQSLSDFESGIAMSRKLVDELAAGPSDLLVSTPAGRQPWPRAALHALFDSSIHERDIALPLGRTVSAPTAELAAIAGYQLLLTARVVCAAGTPLSLSVRLTGLPTFRVTVDGPVVEVVRTDEAAVISCGGEAAEVLDAMAGRGELASVLDGPPAAARALQGLKGFL